MPRFKVLFQCIGQAVCANGVKALAGLVPLGGVVYDIAADALQRLRERQQDDEIRALVEEAVRASPEEVRREADAVAAELAAGQPEDVRNKLGVYLSQLPAGLRQSFKRPSDPAGRTVPFTFSLKRPEDLLPLLPSRLPRFRPGDRPAGVGDWGLVELLGVGGFGEVWKARHVYFDGIAPVALKFCLDPAARERLLQHEAAVLNQVMRQGRHPGIVPLLDASLGADPPCLKYEYIEGGDLTGLVRDWQQGTDRPRWELATRVVLQLAEVVGFAHSLDPPIVHRDLKPANVLVQRAPGGDYRLRVTDFGIGGAAASEAFARARQGTRGDLLGNTLRGAHTPLYASPQQVRGEGPDPRDDVHALGVIWYQLLTGDLASGPPTGLWANELEEMGLSKGLVRLLGACVARPEKRPKDASALAEQFSALLAPAEPAAASKVLRRPEPTPEPPPRQDKLRKFLRTGDTSALSWLLDLTNKDIGDEGAKALADSPRLANLSVLILSGNGIGDEGVKALAGSAHVKNLTRLVLWDNRVGDEGVKALAGCPHLGNLTALDLGRNRVGDDGVKALAGSPTMANLGALILVSNHVGDEGAKALANSPHLANLAELKPLNNHISPAGVSALRERFGKRVRIY